MTLSKYLNNSSLFLHPYFTFSMSITSMRIDEDDLKREGLRVDNYDFIFCSIIDQIWFKICAISCDIRFSPSLTALGDPGRHTINEW